MDWVMSKQPMCSLGVNQPPHRQIRSPRAALGALTVTFVDLGEIRAVALRQRSGKFYEEPSVAGARGARKQERISQAIIHGPKNPPVYVGALRV